MQHRNFTDFAQNGPDGKPFAYHYAGFVQDAWKIRSNLTICPGCERGQRLSQHSGIIGNMRTVALVGTNGSIDWYCYPHFDSPSIFGAILDDKKGGRFQISAAANRYTCNIRKFK